MNPLNEALICDRCYNSNVVRCECCSNAGVRTRPSRSYGTVGAQLREIGETGTCSVCAERSGSIMPYDFRPSYIRVGKGSLHLGTEVEINAPHSVASSIGQRLMKYGMGRSVYFKHDGSVNDGFEIVTMPLTLEEHKKVWLLIEGTDLLADASADGSCGHHIHIGRSSITSLDASKMLHFLNSNNNIPFIVRWAGRPPNRYCQVEQIYSASVRLPSAWSVNDRYRRFNVVNRNSYEIRMFSGTKDSQLILSRLSSVEDFVKWIKQTPAKSKTLDYKDFMEWSDKNGGRLTRALMSQIQSSLSRRSASASQ